MMMAYGNTIATIEYSDSYDKHYELFNQAIDILKTRIANNDDSEFTTDERDVLEYVFGVIESEGWFVFVFNGFYDFSENHRKTRKTIEKTKHLYTATSR